MRPICLTAALTALSILVSPSSNAQEDTGPAPASDVWTYNVSGNTITDPNGWTCTVTSAKTLDSGVREITLQKLSGYGTDGTLDFRKPITWTTQQSFHTVNIVAFSKDFQYGDTTTITNLYLPDTVRTLGQYCFRGLKTAKVIEPFIPDSVTSVNAPFPNISAFYGDLTLGGGGKDLTITGGAGSYKASAIASITFGTGSMTIPHQHFYGYSKCTNILFKGDNVRWHNNAFQAWTEYKAIIKVPIASKWWNDYIATNTTFVAFDSLSSSNQNKYWNNFDPERVGSAPLGAIKLGSGASYQFIFTYDEKLQTRNLVVDGHPKMCGTVVPAYAIYPNEHVGVDAAVECSAPEYATADGIYYKCIGYVTDRLGDNGWEAAQTNLGARSFTYSTAIGRQRVTWLWEEVGYKVSSAPKTIEGYDFGYTTQPESTYPGDYYAKGCTISVTAVATDSDAAPFVRWCGADVPPGHEYDNPLTIKVDAPIAVYPYFTTKWKFANNTVCDGYWKFTASKNSAGNVTLGTAQATSSTCTTWDGGLLDLRKGLENGLIFTEVVKDLFFGSNPTVTTTVRELTLPDTMKKLNEYCFNKCPNLISVTPFLPASVEFCDAAFKESPAITNALTIGSWSLEPAVKLSGDKTDFTNLKKVPSVTFGRGVSALSYQMFYGNDGIKEIYFMGDLPEKNCNSAFQACRNYGKRIFVPSGNASWNTFIAEKLNAWDGLSDSVKNQYTSTWPGAPTPLGCASIGESTQWILKWTPHPMGSVIFIK